MGAATMLLEKLYILVPPLNSGANAGRIGDNWCDYGSALI